MMSSGAAVSASPTSESDAQARDIEVIRSPAADAALHHVGLSPPIIDPEQLILFRIESRPWGRP